MVIRNYLCISALNGIVEDINIYSLIGASSSLMFEQVSGIGPGPLESDYVGAKIITSILLVESLFLSKVEKNAYTCESSAENNCAYKFFSSVFHSVNYIG